ncbi:alpha-L-rhamnosidase C-terminal domain-containing protein [Deinococcus arcticus]|uniref:alpha-L-rhamnosidase C-terminal domain-containing protein n=1 Tax=Deinococcus arcticus TaxID=2136176 RepID=UPI001304AC99
MVEPRPDGRLTHAQTRHLTPYGEVDVRSNATYGQATARVATEGCRISITARMSPNMS